MRRLLLAAALLLCAAPAWAQMGLMGVGKSVYQGPGDIVASATMWWGLQCYTNALAAAGTTKAVRLLRASDSTQQDINCLASGLLDVASAATFCNATTCSVAKLYDQIGGAVCTGSCDVVQATVANQPAFTFNCQGTQPCLQGTTATMLLIGANNFTPASGVMTITAAMGRPSGIGGCVIIRADGNSNRLIGQGSVANQWVLNGAAGTNLTFTAADGVNHSFVGVLNGASSIARVDNTETTGTTAASTTASTPLVGNGAASTTCNFFGGGVWDTATFTAAQRAGMANMQKYFWRM